MGILKAILAAQAIISPFPFAAASHNGVIESRDSSWKVGQIVQTSSGPVQGHAAANASDVSEYLGIPYAQPPVGSLRFQPPVKFNGTKAINGTNFGFSCMSSKVTSNSTADDDQYAKLGVTETALYLLQAIDGSATRAGEDCLTLNVWTKPQVGESKKAVLVFIYGGAFVSGSSAIPWYNGQFFADQEDVVVVNFNYRISLFGFPGNPGTPANIGMMDQRLAVEWVRDNIAAFGGDPTRITLFGQSAGAASVDYYSFAWTSDPIVHGFIPESGTATGFGQQTPEHAAAAWFNVTSIAGCGGSSDDHDKVFQCMLNKTAEDIANSIPSDSVSDSNGALPYGPIIDEQLIFSDYSQRKPVDAPILIGNTDFEAGLFRLFDPSLPDSVWEVVNQNTFNCPAADRAAKSVSLGIPVWRYRYFGVFPNLILTTTPPSEAWHGSELPVLFGTTPTEILPDTKEQIAIGDYMRGAWAAFAKDPAKGLASYEGGWPEYSPNVSTLIRLAFNNQTGTNLALGNLYDVGCEVIPGSGGNSSTTATPTSTTSPTSVPTSGTNAGVAVGAPLRVSVTALTLIQAIMLF